MANQGNFKQLQWPVNLWTEVFGFTQFIKLPEDWEAALCIFLSFLTETEQQVLFAWYRDRRSTRAIQAELRCSGIIHMKNTIVKKMRKSRDMRNVYLYGPAKTELMEQLTPVFTKDIKFSIEVTEELLSKIAYGTSISQMTELTSAICSIPRKSIFQQGEIERILNEYGFSMLRTRKFKNQATKDELILKEILVIFQNQPDKEAIMRRIVDTLVQDIRENVNLEMLFYAISAGTGEDVIKGLTGGNLLSLFARSGTVRLYESWDGTEHWAIVQKPENYDNDQWKDDNDEYTLRVIPWTDYNVKGISMQNDSTK